MRRAVAILLAVLLATLAHASGVTPYFTVPAYAWPTPAFQATGLVVWLEATNATYTSQDALLSSTYGTTFAALEDMSGSGNGFDQPIKGFQPTVDSVTGGMSFAATQFLPCIVPSALNGATQYTVGMVFSAQSVAGSAYRSLLSIDNQVWIYVRSNALSGYLRPGGTGSAYTATGATLTTGVKHRLIVTADMVAGNLSVYLDGSLYASTTWTPGNTAITTPSAIILGNYYSTPLAALLGLPGGGTDEPALAGISVFTLHNVKLSSGAVSTFDSYLATK